MKMILLRSSFTSGGIMRWLNAFRQAREAGRNSFLFVGAIDDGFPQGLAKSLGRSVDALDSLFECLYRQAIKNGYVRSEFNSAQGFVFVDSDSEAVFKEARSGTAETDDPISQDVFAAARESKTSLPKDPVEAIELINRVLSTECERKRRKCLVQLPDLDSWCAMSVGGHDHRTADAALAVANLINRHEFAEFGHLIVMSAPAPSAVHERLTRANSSLQVIEVNRPNEAERQNFLAWLCQNDVILKEKRQRAQTRLRELEEEVRIELKEQLKVVNDKMTVHEAAGENIEQEDPEIARSMARLKELDERCVELATKHRAEVKARYDELVAENAVLKSLERDSVSVERAMTDEIWSNLAIGDVLCIKNPEDPTMIGHKRVLRVMDDEDKDVQVSLSMSNDHEQPHLCRNGEVAWFSWSADDGLMIRPEGADEINGFVSFPYISEWSILILTTERSELIARIKSLNAELETLSKEPPELLQCHAEYTATEKALDEAVDGSELLDAWSEQNEVLLTRHAELEAALAKPDTKEIAELRQELTVLDGLLEEFTSETTYQEPDLGLEQLMQLTQGFSYRDLVNLMQEMRVQRYELNQRAVIDYRKKILNRSYGHMMEIIEPKLGFENIAGLEGVKGFLRSVSRNIQAGDLQRAPMGCLLMGPPGTGKTAITEAFAREAGMLFVKMRNLRSMFVGESERQLEEALQALRDLAPVVVFRDEVDEEDGGRDGYQGDSGVGGRVRRRWMEFLGDQSIRGRIFTISCTNRPDRIDPALKRPGRMDIRIPVLLPDMETRAALFKVMMKRKKFACEIVDFTEFAELTEGCSGADIEVMVVDADRFALDNGRESIQQQDLLDAIADYIPSAEGREVAIMTVYSIADISQKRFLPSNAGRLFKSAKAHLTPQDLLELANQLRKIERMMS